MMFVCFARADVIVAATGVTGGDLQSTWRPVFDALKASPVVTVESVCAAIAALGSVLGQCCPGTDVHGNELDDGVAS